MTAARARIHVEPASQMEVSLFNHRTVFMHLAAIVVLLPLAATAHAQGRSTTFAATRSAGDLRTADQTIDTMIRERTLVVRSVERDALLPDRVHERLDQYVSGVRVVGGDLRRQTASDGTVSVFGTLHTELTLDLTPRLSGDAVRAAIASAAGGEATGPDPELVILPLSDGYHLAYLGQAFAGLEIMNVFVDANTGGPLQQYSDFISDVGKGTGAYGDLKKVSAKAVSGTFVTDDVLRPTDITTYDMKGNLTRLLSILNVQTAVIASDIASDTDNDWTDSTVVDAHVYAGWYYDYLVKRLGRRGTDNNDLRMAVFTHPVRLADIGSASTAVIGQYYLNAFECNACGPNGRGAIVFGEGAPRNTVIPGVEVKPFSAALDVVAHELTHGVTGHSAGLNGFQYSEAGALNEAFSDMFGAATAFFYLPPGNAPMQASYLGGKDLSVPSGALGRSLSNPRSTGDPDHYTQRFVGGDPHYNSTIASHAFYLAIEGGRNATSGLTVQGVGAANREQIEKAFFRALTSLMPSSSTFALTRAATIQAARDLYGVGSAVEGAITQAWDAVGVQPRTVPTAALLPNPAIPSTAVCTGLANPHWLLGVTTSAGASSLRVTQWSLDFFDHTGAVQDHEVFSGTAFAQAFTQCGPGNANLMAQTDACSTFCVDLRGDTNGAAQATFNAVDASGQPIVFSSPRTALLPR